MGVPNSLIKQIQSLKHLQAAVSTVLKHSLPTAFRRSPSDSLIFFSLKCVLRKLIMGAV